MSTSLSRQKVKGRKEKGSFVAVPHALLNHPNFNGLSGFANKLLLQLYGQYKGLNNGDFSMPWSTMRKKGWKSKDTLNNAQKELIAKGFILKTRQGGKNCCNLFAVTWQPIDECNGKHDMNPTKTASGDWKNAAPHSVPTCPDNRAN